MKLSLIVTYRQRANHLKTQIAWWQAQSKKGITSNWELLLVEADESPSTWIESAIAGTSIKYTYLPCSGTFHKTKALNLGLSLSQGQFVAPFDVDLIPLGDTLVQHLQIAQLAPHLLITGYRVMSESETINPDEAIAQSMEIAPEDMPTALWKQLLRKERFGVVPLFRHSQLLKVGGWDEKFIGWGGEDQDIIERYLQHKCYLCRCPELVYLHLSHPHNELWTETALVEQNRKHYYYKRGKGKG